MLKEKLFELIHKQPYGTEEVISIEKIEIKKSFKLCNPREWKMQRCRELYLRKGFLDSPITIHNKYILVDGYTRYLVALELELKEVPIKYL